MEQDSSFFFGFVDQRRPNFIGIKRIRTDILIIDNYVLYQLSYKPLFYKHSH